MADDEKKRNHSKNLLVLLYIAHLLPLACESEEILEYMFFPKDRGFCWYGPRNFHAKFTLNGWNDLIIQPARDAVFYYYKVRTLYPTSTVLALIPILYQPLFILWISATQSHPTSRSTCASIIYPSPSFLWLHTFDRFPMKSFRAILIE